MSNFDELVLGYDPTLYWELTDGVGSTTAQDFSGNGYTGTVAGGGTTMFGVSGLPARLTGTGVSMQGDTEVATSATPVDVVMGLSTPVSLAVWYQTTASSAISLVGIADGISNSEAFYVALENGYLAVSLYENGSTLLGVIADPNPSNDGNWHFVVATWDGNQNLTLYRDGVEVGSLKTAVGSFVTQLFGVALGTATSTLVSFARFAILPALLTPTGVASLYSGVPSRISYNTPTVVMGTPRWTSESTPLQIRWARYYRPLDFQANTFGLSDGSVVTDYPVPISNGPNGQARSSSTNIPYPWDGANAPAAGPSNGTEQVPQGQPFQPWSYNADVLDSVNPRQYQWTYPDADTNVPGEVFQEGPGIVWFMLGGHEYPNISAACAAQLMAAGFGQYITYYYD